MGKGKGYTPEYKKEIIRLITEQGKKVKDVAGDIGVIETSVRRWIKQYRSVGEGQAFIILYRKILNRKLLNIKVV